MSIEEKIRTMETIWDDLCKKAESISAIRFMRRYLFMLFLIVDEIRPG